MNLVNLYELEKYFATNNDHHQSNGNSDFYHISGQSCISHRNQLFYLHCKSNDWLLHAMQHWTEKVDADTQIWIC